jgi:hypothetical protein
MNYPDFTHPSLKWPDGPIFNPHIALDALLGPPITLGSSACVAFLAVRGRS